MTFRPPTTFDTLFARFGMAAGMKQLMASVSLCSRIKVTLLLLSSSSLLMSGLVVLDGASGEQRSQRRAQRRAAGDEQRKIPAQEGCMTYECSHLPQGLNAASCPSASHHY